MKTRTKICVSALSLIQPWAEMVVNGPKSTELRSWNTNFRGPFIVHASKKVDHAAIRHFGYRESELDFGALIGSARLVSVTKYKLVTDFVKDEPKHHALHYADSREIMAAIKDPLLKLSETIYGFNLVNRRKLGEPIPYRGSLNFFPLRDVNIELQQFNNSVQEVNGRLD